MQAHVRLLMQAGYPVTVIAGRGESEALPSEARLILLPQIDSLHQEIREMNIALEAGLVPEAFDRFAEALVDSLINILDGLDILIVHNVFTKHFNLPLTAALHRMIDAGSLPRTIAWSHDMTWTSPNSRNKVYPKYPWDLLRSFRKEITYVAVSDYRRHELAMTFGIEPEQIRVAYNGVDPQHTLGLSPEGFDLISRLSLMDAELILLMPVRITQAKNIEFAIRVAASIKSSGKCVKLILTGPPDPHDADNMRYYQSLKDLCREYHLEDTLHFIYESGPIPGQAYLIDEQIVGDLYRVSDVLFMPSHREGFGMPVLEAGLTGIPVVCTASPAAVEIGGDEVTNLSLEHGPEVVAGVIIRLVQSSPLLRLRRRIRQEYTWQALFKSQVEPLLFPGT